MTAYPSFIIKVLVVGRKEPIESPAYEDRGEAERDLKVLQDARINATEASLSWINMSGGMLEVASIEDRTIHA